MAARAAAAARADGGRRDRARALAHRREPAPTCSNGPPPRPRRPRRRPTWRRWCASTGAWRWRPWCCGPALMAPARRTRCSPPCSASPGRCRRSGPGGSAGRGRRAAPMPCRRRTAPTCSASRATPGACSSAASCAEDHHLPPDNLQTAPHDMVAHRTSPTNIGLYLLATCARREFGWIGTPGCARRGWRRRSPACATLPRHRGHFLNWYDTRARAGRCCRSTSPPSTAATSACTCSRWPRPASSSSRAPATTAALRRELAAARRRGSTPCARGKRAAVAAPAPPSPPCSTMPTRCVEPSSAESRRAAARLDAALAELRAGAARVREQRSPTSPLLAPGLGDRGPARDLALGPARPSTASTTRRRRLGARSPRPASGWPREPDFAFLYHRKRRLFHIGFRVAEHQLDASFYDLLASESRADQPVGDRQGRRAGQPLGRARPAVLRRRRARRPALLVGLDVRVPDAVAGARRAARQRAARAPRTRPFAEQIAFARGASRALGHLRVGLRRQRPHAGLPVRAAGRARAWRCAARRSTSWWSRPMRPRSPPRSRRTAPSPTCAARSGAARAAATASSKRSTSRQRASRATRRAPESRPSWRTTRA